MELKIFDEAIGQMILNINEAIDNLTQKRDALLLIIQPEPAWVKEKPPEEEGSKRRSVPRRSKGQTWKIMRDFLSTGLCTMDDLKGVCGIKESAVRYHLTKHKGQVVWHRNDEGYDCYTLRPKI